MPLRSCRCRITLALALLLNSFLACAEDGVSPHAIRVGMVNAQSGPAAGLGVGMRAGVAAYFQRINAAGGVNGRQLNLISHDDGYEPERSLLLTQQLLTSDKVFALIGYVGTPTSRAVLPLVMQSQVPYLFPFSGAESLRTPQKQWVFNLRASYIEEAEELVEHMTADLHRARVALILQDDSFGESVKSAVAGALSKRGMRIHAEARIQRNALAVNAAVQTLQASNPDAIIFVGTYQQLAATLQQAKASQLNAPFFTVSFIGTEDFIAAAGADAEGVYISQVMPVPRDRSLPLIREYLADIPANAVGYTSLEGYINARVFVEALADTDESPTRAELVDALQYLHRDLGGFKVKFSPSRHQGSDAVFLTRIQDGQAVPIERM